MKFFWLYIRQRRKGILIFFLFCFIFLVTFCLYHFPVQAVLYPSLLCLASGGCFLAADYWKARRRHREMAGLPRLPEELMKELPEADSQEARDYQELIAGLCESYKDLENRMTGRYCDMIEYYTVWAHQIKTPIASMRLHLQSEDSELSRRLSEDLSRIEQYVEMVLCYLRLDSDTTDYVIQEYDLDSLIRQAVKKFAGSFIRKKIRLEYSPLKKRVLTDEKWLSFVLEQLLSNALKYTPSGTVRIDWEEPDTLCVRDTGIGIEPEDLPRIFDRGYTGYNGRGDKKASGIGLYLCRRICGNLGHSIRASSVPGSGTVIKIGLERKKLEVE